jgi:hypothetical protein
MNERSQKPPQVPTQQAIPSAFPPAPQRISVVDFDMPFGRMVVFMIKWAFAAIPALIVIWTVVFVCLIIFATFFGGLAALSQHH